MNNNINVMKKDNTTEPLNIKKIQKETYDATFGLSNVSQSELEVDAQIHFFDGVSTSSIQHSLISTAVDKIDIDRPNWTFVAARLTLYDLYHNVGKKLKFIKGNAYPDQSFKKYIKNALQEKRMSPIFLEKYSDSDIVELSRYIKPERDMNFNYLGIKTLIDRYLLKDIDKNLIELPQQMFMSIAMFLAQKEKNNMKWAKKFYDMISKFEVMLATPTLSNARTNRHQLSSCYIGSTPDNIEGIFDSYREKGLLSKFGGGIGWDWTKVRAGGSFIDGHKSAAGGTTPFLKIENDVAIAVDQLGTRKGAIAVYLEPWHMDINDFLDLKKNSGEERRRAHDLFPALWINDLFMERVQEDAEWTLFDPYQVSELTNLYGEEFNKKYLELEQNTDIVKDKINAKALWKKILTSYFESGSPFLTFKDNANRVNPNNHSGLIRSSNLCTEIFQNTEPDHYKIKFYMTDGEILLFEELEKVNTNVGEVFAKDVTALHTIDEKEIYNIEKERIAGKTAVCNLASVNLSKINTKEDIERIVPVAIRCLDNVIDLNFYPLKKVKDTNLSTRAIGLGVMGEAQMLAENGIHWGDTTHFNKIDEIMEMISYNAILSSSNLAIEKGEYPLYSGSNWSQGILPKDFANTEVKALTNRATTVYNWDELKELIKKQKMRNGYLMAVAPTSSISILTGTTQAIEPVYKKKWMEENLSGLIPVVVPKLSPDTWNFYPSAYEVEQTLLIKAAAVRQKWIDQGQSLNIFITLDKASGKYLNDIYMLAWKLGLKSTYYLRSQSPEAVATDDIADRSIECSGCQ